MIKKKSHGLNDTLDCNESLMARHPLFNINASGPDPTNKRVAALFVAMECSEGLTV
jgi:hypothetical protein